MGAFEKSDFLIETILTINSRAAQQEKNHGPQHFLNFRPLPQGHG
jgi:hypothetical protein